MHSAPCFIWIESFICDRHVGAWYGIDTMDAIRAVLCAYLVLIEHTEFSNTCAEKWAQALSVVVATFERW